MPRVYHDRVDDGGEAYYVCKECGTDLVLASDLISDEFRSGAHKALLFSGVLNVDRGEPHSRDMTSGQHTIQNIYCTHCQKELGWVKAADASNRYKEGNFILVVPDIVSHPHRGGVVDADTAAAAAARKRKRSSSSAAAAGEGESAASAAASSSDMAPAIPFATLSRSRYSTGGVSRSGSLSSASSAASEGTPPSGSQSSSRSRSIGSSMVDDDEADDGDASIPPDSTSALLSRLRALRRSLGPPQSSGSSAIHQTLASLLPDPHLSPDSPQPQQQQQQQPRSTTGADRGRQLVRAAQLAFISGHPPPPV